MADPRVFGDDLLLTAKNIVTMFDHLTTMNQRITEDPTLLEAVIEDFSKQVPEKRPDLTVEDLTGFNDALVQLLFTYTSGAPSQKAKIFQLL